MPDAIGVSVIYIYELHYTIVSNTIFGRNSMNIGCRCSS